jgi:hypothetical protein
MSLCGRTTAFWQQIRTALWLGLGWDARLIRPINKMGHKQRANDINLMNRTHLQFILLGHRGESFIEITHHHIS